MRFNPFEKIAKCINSYSLVRLLAAALSVLLPPFSSSAKSPDGLVQPNETFVLTAKEVQFINSLAPLKVMVDDDFVPLSTYDAEEGAYHGISVDLFRHISERLGLKFRFLHDPQYPSWSDKEDLLKAGKIDMLMPVSFTAQRASSGIFTASFYDTYYGVIGKNTNSLRFKDSYDLATYRVGVTKASAIISFIQSFVPATNIVHYGTQKAMYHALRNGEIDIALQNKNVFREDRFNMGFIDLTMLHTIVESPRKYSYYFTKSDPHSQLIEIINRYLAGIDLQRLISHYDQGEDQLIQRYTEQKNRQKLLLLGIIGLLALLTLVSATFLNHRRLTAKLKASLKQIQLQQVELQKSEHLLKESQRAAFVGSYKIDVIKGVFESSEVLDRIFGIDKDFGKSVQGWLDLVHPDDKDRVDHFLNEAGESTGETFALEYKIIRRSDNEIRWIHCIGEAVSGADGNLSALIGTIQDVSERKRTEEALRESEERYQSILIASPDNITITDIEGKIQMISPSGVNMFGYGREREVIGDSVYKHLVPEDRDRAMANLTLKARGVFLGPDEYRGLRKDGSTFDVEVMSNFIRDDAGRPTRVVIIVRDITERKQIEEERKRMLHQLQQAQKMEAIGTLAGGIAHDFNNILGAILGYAEMARDGCPPESVIASDLNEVISAGNRAKDLVKQILAFSRQTEAQKLPLLPSAIVKEAILLLRSSIPTTIDFQQDIDSEADLILADATQFHQIVMNLCTNAYHAMEETGGTLSISLKNIALAAQDLVSAPYVRPGRFVQLSIGDTGSGIAPEILERIFDPYFTTKETGKGTGMGLAIVHGIVKGSDGFLTCHSEMGAGTVFEIFLPALSEEIAPKIEEVSTAPSGTERILFIDDEETLARMGKTMLEKLGYVVTTRMSSVQALATFNEQPDAFDLVITDQTMPEMTGFDLAQRILRIRPGMPIILCTGYSSQISKEKARAYGIKGFAMKPFAKKALANLIREILDGEKYNKFHS